MRDFAELRALAAIVEHKSFARAAKQLRVTPSALSQTIRAFEARLGVRLLNRTTRSVAVTEDGATLLHRALPALAEVDAALGEASDRKGVPSGLLRINTLRAVAFQFFAPRLASFLRAHPQVTLDLVIDDRFTDIVAAGFDAGVRLGESLAKDMVAVRIGGEQQQVAVASPAYVKAHGTPRHPRELANHRCINLRMPSGGELYRWEFERRRKRLDIAVEGSMITNDVWLAQEAALQGVGIAYLFREQVQPAIDAGRLLPMLEAWSPPFAGFYLYHPSHQYVRPALRAFIDFLRKG